MRRRLWIGAVATCLAWLGACADRPLPRSPSSHGARHGQPSARAYPDADADADPIPLEPAGIPAASPGAPPGPPTPLFATNEQMSERYGQARALAVQRGSASYYADSFAGRKTASGVSYEPRALMAAHRTLPFGSVLRVTRTDGGACVYVRVTDRGPFGPRGRILDLSRAAAEQLGMLRAGVVKVRLEVVEYGPPPRAKRKRGKR